METLESITTPLVSVLLPVYNAQATVLESINSILNQTYQNIELIIINDGSKDLSEQKIQSIKDDRIKYLINESNKGLIYTLNRGIQLAKGKYIARMDADDISVPSRIEKQVKLMEENLTVIVCGTNIELFGNIRKKTATSFLQFGSSESLKARLIKVPCFAHPTVMIRKSVLDKYRILYDKDYLHAEDYKMWMDLSSYGDFYNIKEKLLYYRISDTQITQSTNRVQIDNAKKCRRIYLRKYIKNNFVDEFERNGVTIELIRHVRRTYNNRYLLDVLYLSLEKYGWRVVLYYIFSLDFVRLGKMTFLQFMKRVLFSPNPYL